MNGYGTHEAITRKGQPAAPMRTEDVVLRPMDGYPDIKTFRCSPLCADIQPSACKSNYLSQKSVSCKSCLVGAMHADVAVQRTAIDVLNDPNCDPHARAAAANGLPCIRCGKSGFTNKRLIGRMRLIRGCVCVSCFNREREIVVGRNSKGAKPVKWAGLRQTVLTVESESGKWTTLAPIMTAGRDEAERYVERKHPGHTIVECFFDGVAIQPTEKAPTFADIAREAGLNPATARSRAKKNNGSIEAPAPRKAPKIKRASLALECPNDSPSISPAWKQVFGNPAPETKKRGISSWSEERQAEYADSLLAAIRDAERDAHGMRDLAQWLLEGIPSGPWLYIAPARKPAEASAPVADAIAPADVAEPVSEPDNAVADDLSEAEVIAEDEQVESEWDGCFVETDGVRVYVTAYAAEHGISDWDAAVELGVCEPEGDEPDEEPAPEQIAAPAPARTRKITGKQARKAEKAARRGERLAHAQRKRPSNPKQIAVTARAFIEVMYAMGGAKR